MSIHEIWDDITEDEIKESSFKERESDNYPDGLYDWKIVKFDYFQGKDGREYHKFGLEVSDGVLAGKYTETFGSDTRIGIRILKEKLYLLTGRIPEVSEVYDAEENRAGSIKGELLGKLVSGRKVTKRKDGKEYVSIYFNSLPVAPYMGQGDPPPPGDDDYVDEGSVPF